MFKKEDILQEGTCQSVAHVPFKISTPISLKPCIRKLPISAEICGEPELTPTPCGTYILTQSLCVKIPMEIDINYSMGKPYPHYNCPPGCNRPIAPGCGHTWPPNVVIG